MPIVPVSLPVEREKLLGNTIKLSLGGYSATGRTIKEAAAKLANELEPHPDSGRMLTLLDEQGKPWTLACFPWGCSYATPGASPGLPSCSNAKRYSWKDSLAAMQEHMAQYYR